MEEAMAFATCAFSSVISSLNATMTPPSFLSIAARNAFGVVAMVAMTPLITIQILGMVYQLKQQKSGAGIFAGAADAFGALDENAIIEL